MRDHVRRDRRCDEDEPDDEERAGDDLCPPGPDRCEQDEDDAGARHQSRGVQLIEQIGFEDESDQPDRREGQAAHQEDRADAGKYGFEDHDRRRRRMM